jgi:dipeptidyl aminopeptidase/acylaminoacyl peptidase
MSFIRPRRAPLSRTPDACGISGWESVSFLSADGLRLAGWFLPPDPSGDGATVILLHGARTNRTEMLPQAAMLHRHGYGVLLYDHRAHGQSEGQVSTLGYAEVEDLRGAVAYLQNRPEVDAARIGVLGHSLGGAVAIRGAARIPEIRAVVAEGAYTSVEENLASGVRVFLGLPRMPFVPLVVFFGQRETGLNLRQVRPVDEVGRIAPRPILVVHGMQDPAVPLQNARRLYDAAGEPKELYLVAEAGHGGYAEVAPREFEERVVGFLDRYLRGP